MAAATVHSPLVNDRWHEALKLLGEKDQALFDIKESSKESTENILLGALEAVENRKNECLKKRWKVVVKGKVIILRDVLDKISVGINKILKFGDLVVQYDPSHAALPWAAFRLLMQASVNDVNTFGYMTHSTEGIVSIIAQCMILEEILAQKGTLKVFKEMSKAITDLYVTVLNFLAKMLQYFRTNTAVRLVKSVVVSQKDMEEMYSGIENARSEVNALVQIILCETSEQIVSKLNAAEVEQKEWQLEDEIRFGELQEQLNNLQTPITRINQQLSDIHDGLQQETRINILKAISTVSYGVQHKTASKNRLEGTGQWLLSNKNFKDWRASSASSTLWLHGIPGSGKTKLASLVIDEVRGKENMAYFYCMRNPAEPQRAECEKILASLVRQLACVSPGAPLLAPVVDCYKDAIEGFDGFEDQQWTAEESSRVLLQLINQFNSVVLVLDALDEVKESDRGDLMDILGDIVKEASGLVKIFISSRDNLDISLAMKDSPNVYISADENGRDIEAFVNQQLDAAKLLRGKLSSDFRVEIVHTLLTRAKGMFRWVDLQIQSLRPLKLAADIKTRLGKLPETLESSYWEIYEQIQASGENAFRLANFTFQWLLYAQDKLSLRDFAKLASVAIGSVEDADFTKTEVLDVCSNLVVSQNSGLEFAHLSVREFLENFQIRSLKNFLPNQGNAALASACLLCLIKTFPTTPEGLEAHYDPEIRTTMESIPSTTEKAIEGNSSEVDLDVMSTEEDLDKYTIESVLQSTSDTPSLSRYVISYWLHHAKESHDLRLSTKLDSQIKTLMVSGPNVSAIFKKWWKMRKVLSDDQDNSILPSGEPNPIWIACFCSWLDMVEYLYSLQYPGLDSIKSFTLGSESWYGDHLWYAVVSGNLDLLKCLMKCGADPLRTRLSESEPLVRAASTNDSKLLSILLEKYQGEDKVVGTALEAAASRGHCDIIATLLKMMATMANAEQMRYVALCSACKQGHENAVELLSSELSERVKKRGTPFEFAVFYGYSNVLKILLARGVGSTTTGLSKGLITAVSNGDSTIVDLLVEHGAEKEGPAVIRAIKAGTPMAAMRLIQSGFDVKGRYLEKARTALHYAAEKGFTNVAKAILDRGAEANIYDRDRHTPLHLAALRGHDVTYALLLENGADPMAMDREQKTPVDRRGERALSLSTRNSQVYSFNCSFKLEMGRVIVIDKPYEV